MNTAKLLNKIGLTKAFNIYAFCELLLTSYDKESNPIYYISPASQLICTF